MLESPTKTDSRHSLTNDDSILVLLIRIGAFLCLAGWTWVNFYWEGPYGALLWKGGTFDLVEKLGYNWEDFVGTEAGGGLIRTCLTVIAWLYLVCTIVTLTVGRKSRLQMAVLIGGSILLVGMAYAKFLGAQRQPPMFVEHGGQFLMPVLLVLALSRGPRDRWTIGAAMAAFIMIFVGHGCYAVGFWWPTPSNFLGMTTVILPFDLAGAKMFLLIAGLLDFLVCVGIFFPAVRRPAALYAAIWGLLTALARPVAGMSWDLNYWGADQYLHEAILRAPHYLIPLYLFFVWRPAHSAAQSLSPITSSLQSEESSSKALA